MSVISWWAPCGIILAGAAFPNMFLGASGTPVVFNWETETMSGHEATPSVEQSARRDRRIDLLWLGVLAIGTTWWCLTAAVHTGLTYDENFYLGNFGRMHDIWDRSCTTLCRNGVMPLPTNAATFPLCVKETISGTQVEDPIEYTRWARAVTLGWFWLLIVSALRLGRDVGGSWAGRIAAGLIATDPNMLAHASLATTDMAASASLMAFTRAVYAGRGGGWWQRITLPGLWFGVAVLCKMSGLLYGGLILVMLELAHRVASGGFSRPAEGGWVAWLRKVAGACVRSLLAISAVVAIGVAIALVYCGIPKPGAKPMAAPAVVVPKESKLWPLYQRLAEEYDQVPNALVAFAFQLGHNEQKRPCVLNGIYYPQGVPYFFPGLLLLKLPLPALALMVVCFTRPRAANPLALVAALMLLSTWNAGIQIGVRLVLPVVALGYTAVAVGVIRGLGRPGRWAGIAAVGVMAATSAWVWPHGLCYLNQLHGGPWAAQEMVTDSNCDWGQGIPDLLAWHRTNGEPPISLWYFGTDPAAEKPPFTKISPESLTITSGDDLRAAVGRRVLAIGVTNVTLQPDAPPSKAASLAYLRTRRVLARTPTFVLYDFRDPEGPPPRE